MRRGMRKNGVTISNRPLSEAGVAREYLADLGELAQVRTVRDFALLGAFPDHCTTLADWLGLSEQKIRSIAARAAALVPPDELRAAVERARTTTRFPLGIHPPRAA